MKKLLILPILAVAACGQQRGVHEDWATGAHFGPSHKVEFQARAARGEPGVFPAPSGYSVYTAQQRRAAGAADASSVPRQGTVSSRTGEYATNGAVSVAQVRGGRAVSGASTNLRSSPYRANALVAAKEARGKGQEVNLAGQRLDVYHIDVGTSSYAVFRKRSGIGGGSRPLDASLGSEMVAALPSLTGCSSVAGPFRVGPGGRLNTHMVYALNC